MKYRSTKKISDSEKPFKLKHHFFLQNPEYFLFGFTSNETHETHELLIYTDFNYSSIKNGMLKLIPV